MQSEDIIMAGVCGIFVLFAVDLLSFEYTAVALLFILTGMFADYSKE